MKRVLFLMIVLLLIAGCAFKPAEIANYVMDLEEGTTAKNIVAFNGSSPANGGAIADTDPDNSDVQGIIYVYFDDFIKDATVTDCFEMTEENDAANIDYLTVTYERDLKRVKIVAEFNDDGAYLLTIAAEGFESVTGSFLDGNGNGINDGSPYDDVLLQFYTGAGAVDMQDHVNPTFTSFAPVTGRINPVTQNIIIQFSEPIDSDLVVDNVELFKSGGGSVNGDTLIFQLGEFYYVFDIPDNVVDITKYYVSINCAALHDQSDLENMLLPPGWDYVEGIGTYTYEFMTAKDDPDDDDTPPSVASVVNNGDHVKIDFTEEMDIATLTDANIIVLAYYDGRFTHFDADFIIDDDKEGLIVPLINALSNDITVIIRKEVTDEAGFMLDNNGNGIGGEVEDKDRVYYPTSDDYRVDL